MSILNDIRSQSRPARLMMFGLSVVTTVSMIGVVWFSSMEHDMFVLLNSEEEYQKKFLAKKQELQQPTLLAFLGQGLSGLQAAIYGALNIGLDQESGVPGAKEEAQVLPLSGER